MRRSKVRQASSRFFAGFLRPAAWRGASRNAAGDRAASFVERADKYRDSKDWHLAADAYRQALDAEPAAAHVWVQYGNCLKEAGSFGAAVAAYGRARDLDASNWDTYLQLGHALKLQGSRVEAAQAYRAALRLHPLSDDAQNELRAVEVGLAIESGNGARNAASWADAAQHYWRALTYDPTLAHIWVQLGHALKEQGLLDAAEQAYRASLALAETSSDSWLQLGHLLKCRGRRLEAVAAYGRAVLLENASASARAALGSVIGYSPLEIEAVLDDLRSQFDGCQPKDGRDAGIRIPSTGTAPAPAGDSYVPPTKGIGWPRWGQDARQRHKRLLREATRRTAVQVPGSGRRRDVVWLSNIDWHYRIQRPQHLAAAFADAGDRVVFVSPTFEACEGETTFRFISSPHPGVFEVRLCTRAHLPGELHVRLGRDDVDGLQAALDDLIVTMGLEAPILVLGHPNWFPVAHAFPQAIVAYDCADEVMAFENANPSVGQNEADLIAEADLVITSSQPLARRVGATRHNVLIRNGAEIARFSPATSARKPHARPTIGYFGLIASWFESSWIAECARARPEWDFMLVGEVAGCDVSALTELPNVRLLGEQPYSGLPALLARFDVAVIPFATNALTHATNPVKLYEYLAGGCPVVTSPMPEVAVAAAHVLVADDSASFEQQVARALADDTEERRLARTSWARQHDWSLRAAVLRRAFDGICPQVSVVVVGSAYAETGKGWMRSLRLWADYQDFEAIDLVAPLPSKPVLDEEADASPALELLRQHTSSSASEFLVYVPSASRVVWGWVRMLIRPMLIDASVTATRSGVDPGGAGVLDQVGHGRNQPLTVQGVPIDQALVTGIYRGMPACVALRRGAAIDFLERCQVPERS